jgi:hypothetical protein
VNPPPWSSLGDEKACLFVRFRSAAHDPCMLMNDVGLRGAACLWQAVPKRFTRTEFLASALAEATAERRRHVEMSGISSRRDQSAKVRYGRHCVGSTSWRSE